MALNNTNNTYTAKDIANYLSGKLTAQEMHAIEKQALQDPFLADAIEGFAQADDSVTQKHLYQIQEKISSKKEQNQAKIIPFKKHSKYKKTGLAIAASILAVITTITLYNNNKTLTKSSDIAAVKSITTEVEKTETLPKPQQNINKTNTVTTKKETLIKKDNVTSAQNPANINSLTTTTSTNDNILESEKPLYQDIKIENLNNETAVTKEKLSENKNNTKSDELKNDDIIKDVNTTSIASNATNNKSNNFFTPSNSTISGKIVNQNNEPIPFASIQLNNSKQFTTTNANGVFNIQPNSLRDTNVSLNVNAIGYQNLQVNVGNNNANVIKLNNDDRSMNEVVVVNARMRDNKKLQKATVPNNIKIDSSLVPQGGWVAFNKYLENNNAYSNTFLDTTVNEFKTTRTFNSSQEVVLSFSIDDEGSPIKIKIEKSINKAVDAKAINLLKNGPKWKTNNSKKKNKVAFVVD